MFARFIQQADPEWSEASKVEQGPMAEPAKMDLSVVIPVFDEEENAAPLVRDIAAVVRKMGLRYEIILVDDGSTDRTVEVLRALLPEVPELVIVALRRNFGQTAALQAGLERSCGEIILTMDGDRQNDPRDIPKMLERLEAGADVVSGWRKDRQDQLVVRKLPSWIANRLIQWLTRVPVHDQGCSLKAYRRAVVERLNLYSDMHRFIVVLTMPMGAAIDEVEVRHHPRVAGRSKYGLSRVFKVLGDLLAIKMLTSFRHNPIRWFAVLAMPFFAGTILASLAALFQRDSLLVLPTVAILLSLLCVWSILAGFLAQAIVEWSGKRSLNQLTSVAQVWRNA